MVVVVAGVTSTNADLARFRDDNGIGDWVVFAEATGDTLRTYSIRQQGTKLAIGRDGLILERKPLSSNPKSYWQGVLDQLLASPAAAAPAPAQPEPTATTFAVAAQPATPTTAPPTTTPAQLAPPPAPVVATQVATPTSPVPTATPVPVVAQGWRTDLAVGGNVGEVAPDSTLMLVSGETTTVQAFAAGRPVIVYFFETW